MKNFRKEDLKTGMLAQCRNGRVYMVINEMLVSENGHNSISDWNEDLTDAYNLGNGWDIVKVSKTLTSYNLKINRWTIKTLNANLLWERKDIPEYVEVKHTDYSKDYNIGDVCIVARSNGHKLYLIDTSGLYPDGIYFRLDEVKPSTKEAYEAQFIVNEMTIEQLEKLTGLTNIKIKK
jgi:hypothetical protein